MGCSCRKDLVLQTRTKGQYRKQIINLSSEEMNLGLGNNSFPLSGPCHRV